MRRDTGGRALEDLLVPRRRRLIISLPGSELGAPRQGLEIVGVPLEHADVRLVGIVDTIRPREGPGPSQLGFVHAGDDAQEAVVLGDRLVILAGPGKDERLGEPHIGIVALRLPGPPDQNEGGIQPVLPRRQDGQTIVGPDLPGVVRQGLMVGRARFAVLPRGPGGIALANLPRKSRCAGHRHEGGDQPRTLHSNSHSAFSV